MGMTHEQLVQKAVITTDAIAAAGKLSTEQADRFLDYVIDETVLRQNARIVRVKADEWEIDKIGVGSRVAMPHSEAQDPALRRGVTTSKVTLSPKKIIVPFEISDEFKEENIEGESVEDHIVKMMATQSGNDVEELFINGDLLGAAVLESDLIDGGSSSQYIKDSFLALQDGWIRGADAGNSYDAAGANIGASVFSRAINQMPTKFRRNRGNLRFFGAPDLWQLWMEKVSTRATAMGDMALGGSAVTKAFGVPGIEVPLMPFQPSVVQHVALPGTTVVSLRYAPIASVVVTRSTLANAPEAAYVSGVDYTLDTVNGTIARIGSGAIADGQTVKVTYVANPQLLLTHQQNLIVGISQDVRIEKARAIYRGVNQYAITIKVGVAIEEPTAVVKVKNIGMGV